MSAITKITSCEDVALITLRGCPADMSFISGVFGSISKAGINVDMISQTAPLGGRIGLSFSVGGGDLSGVLEIIKKLREQTPELKSEISAGNCKLSLSGDAMRDLPGVAAEAFAVMAGINADVRLITTSEIDISVLVPQSDYENVRDALNRAFGSLRQSGMVF